MRIGVYSPNWIGDSVIALPFIQTLKNQEQDAEIIIICNDWVSGVYENHSAVKDVIPFSKIQLTGIINVLRTGQSLKRLKFDKFYTLTDSFRSAFILWLSGARNRYGYEAQMRSIFLSETRPQPSKTFHRSKKYLNLIKVDSESSVIPEIHLSNFERDWAIREMKKLGLNDVVALSPFSVASNRTIPIAILSQWIKNSENDYLVFGSRSETEMGKILINNCDGMTIKSICGIYSLRESIALISVCNHTLATDSGLGHISAALGLPTISFFGAGVDTVTSPIGNNIKVIKHCSPCLGELCTNLDNNRKCIKKISRFDIEVAVNEITNL